MGYWEWYSDEEAEIFMEHMNYSIFWYLSLFKNVENLVKVVYLLPHIYEKSVSERLDRMQEAP
jgi:hypothetical protein